MQSKPCIDTQNLTEKSLDQHEFHPQCNVNNEKVSSQKAYLKPNAARTQLWVARPSM